jgi:hypothetical protein
MDAEPAKRPAELNEGHPENQGESPASSDSHASKIRKIVSERLRPGVHSMVCAYCR